MHWWTKVRMELEARGLGLRWLAERTGVPLRTLERHVIRAPDAEPSAEARMCEAVARALRWRCWWLMSPSTSWPPPPGLVELYEAVEALPSALSHSVVDSALRIAAEHVRAVLESHRAE